MKLPLKFCPKLCGGDTPTGAFVAFYAHAAEHRALEVYRCSVCGDLFALDYYGSFVQVPEGAVAS